MAIQFTMSSGQISGLRFKAEAINELKGKLSALRKKIGCINFTGRIREYVELFNTLKEMEQELVFDVLIIDEWQNMCSSINSRNYKLIKRDYTIGLSATPIRQKGENFYPLEKLFFNSQNRVRGTNGELGGVS